MGANVGPEPSGASGREGEAGEVRHEGFHHGASYVEHLRFIEALRSGSAPAVGVDEGLWSVAVGEAAHRSIDEGRPVLLAELGMM